MSHPGMKDESEGRRKNAAVPLAPDQDDNGPKSESRPPHPDTSTEAAAGSPADPADQPPAERRTFEGEEGRLASEDPVEGRRDPRDPQSDRNSDVERG